MSALARRLPYLSEADQAMPVLAALEGLRPGTLLADDGVPLAWFEAGTPGRPVVLLVNALGVSVVLLAALAQALARDYHVLLWESRGLPDLHACDPARDLSVARQARDAAQVLDTAGGRAHAVVAYCSGANTAVHGLAHGLLRAGRLLIASPSMVLPGVAQQTDYQRTMLPMWVKVAQEGQRYAALVRLLLQKNPPAGADATSRALLAVNALPFASDASTHRYALLQAACQAEDWHALLPRVDVPARVLHGEQDDLIHLESARAVAEGLGRGSFLALPDAGHFGVFQSRALHEAAIAFLGSPLADTPVPLPHDTEGARHVHDGQR
ncbi:Probable multi-domain beta keto-acyl synthase-possibly involved in fatty acid or polyketide biosynthesis [plant metagenome]|uniref:Probable multi-domain beta keto-acyl synthase-possibly involved in fatty acid or polyketide biosynthesis n=1 Tax=plant metagenome TaxID=1297885 RepID=A0A484NXV5_9ZZZZ